MLLARPDPDLGCRWILADLIEPILHRDRQVVFKPTARGHAAPSLRRDSTSDNGSPHFASPAISKRPDAGSGDTLEMRFQGARARQTFPRERVPTHLRFRRTCCPLLLGVWVCCATSPAWAASDTCAGPAASAPPRTAAAGTSRPGRPSRGRRVPRHARRSRRPRR